MTAKFNVKGLSYLRSTTNPSGHRIAEAFEDVGQAIAQLQNGVAGLQPKPSTTIRVAPPGEGKQAQGNPGFPQPMPGQTFLGAWVGPWSSTTGYIAGQQVFYPSTGSATLYTCILESEGNEPDTSPTFWSNGGSWSGYFVGNEVTYGGNYWVCTATTGLSTTPPSLTNTSWQLVGPTNAAAIPDIQLFTGPWSSTTAYVPGNETTYSGDYWLCLVANTNSPPALGNTNWQLVGSGSLFEGEWLSTTDYEVGQEVTYNGNLYLCLLTNTNKEPDTNPSYWQKQGGALSFLGAWSSATAYVIGQMVSYNASVWLCLISNTNSAPAIGNTNWQIIGSQAEFTGPWSSTTSYVIGQEASYNGAVYLALVANTNVVPTSSTTDWQNVSGISFVGPWSSTTAYVESQSVSYNNNTYLCLVGNTNVIPPSNTTDWLVMGPANASALPGSHVYQGAWNSTTAYVTGNEVSDGGNYWLCIFDNTNSEPSQTNTNWQLVGPTSASALAESQIYMGAYSTDVNYDPANQVTYNGQYWLCVEANGPSTSISPPPSTAWVVMGPETATDLPGSQQFLGPWIGPWNYYTAYVAGNQVTYTDGNEYTCKLACTNVIPTNTTYWTLVGPWAGYVPGNEVTDQGDYWICLTATSTEPSVVNSAWQLVGPSVTSSVLGAEAFEGAWSPTIDYDPGNQVAYLDGNYYLCLVANGPAETVQPPSFNYRGLWTTGSTYNPSQLVVDSSGNYWLCLVANSSSTPPSGGTNWLQVAKPLVLPTASSVSTIVYSAYWTLMGPAVAGSTSGSQVYLGLWSAELDYDPGNEVIWPQNGAYWVCLNATALGNNTIPGQTSANGIVYWAQIAPPAPTGTTVLPWNATTHYYPGNDVTYAPSLSGTGNTAALPPTVAAQVARGSNSWSNINNALGSSSYATCVLYASNNQVNESYLLQFTGFNFSSVPSNATITGIVVSNHREQTAGTSGVFDDNVSLIGVTGTSQNLNGPYPTNPWSSGGTVAYGSSTNTWGLSPAALLAAIQAGTLGVQFGCESTLGPGTGADVGINSITMTVYYATSGQGTSNPYTCLVENGPGSSINAPEPPSTSPTYWELMASASLDAVKDGQSYARTLTAGVVSGMPYTLQGAYSSSVAYVTGQEVTYNGNYYLCTSNTTAGTPPTNTSHWTLIGPTTSDAITSGSTTGIPLQTQIPSASALSGAYGYPVNTTGGSGVKSIKGVGDTQTLSLDGEIHDGSTYYRMPAANMDSNRRGLIDFTQSGHLNKILDNIADGSTYGRTLITGLSGGYVQKTGSGGGYAIKGVGDASTLSLDSEVHDGSTYLRMPGSNMDSNRRGLIDFSQGGHIGKSLGNIPDATGRYAVVNGSGMSAVSSVDGNNRALIDFTQGGHVGKTLVNIPDGSGRYAVTNMGSGNAVASVDGSNLALINFASAHSNKNLDNIGDGGTYWRLGNVNSSHQAQAASLAPNSVNIRATGSFNNVAITGTVSVVCTVDMTINTGDLIYFFFYISSITSNASGNFFALFVPGQDWVLQYMDYLWGATSGTAVYEAGYSGSTISLEVALLNGTSGTVSGNIYVGSQQAR